MMYLFITISMLMGQFIFAETFGGTGHDYACSPVPGAALFISPYDIGIKIYKADGRLAYSGELHEGENRLSLDPGVYIWTTRNPQPVTRNQSGKVVIR
ncbi:MAG: hypothetical protein ABIM59_01340 [candidate division WOR-3 bacterium]